jgi:recombination protein RecR
MANAKYSSTLLSDAVEQFSSLPGIGERTALRLVLFLLKQEKTKALAFSKSIKTLIENVQFCETCHNISDDKECTICRSTARDRRIICVVENVKDVMSIEQTQQFNGLYHVLGGIISPMEGVGPQDLNIVSLIERVQQTKATEVILALSATMEGDTTNFYIYKKLKDLPVSISIIARGISFGNELEYTDELTLGRSILNRHPFDGKIGV